LNCRQQQRDQDADDGNHNQEFDERKGAVSSKPLVATASARTDVLLREA
jgi:hypothetical protein